MKYSRKQLCLLQTKLAKKLRDGELNPDLARDKRSF